MIQANELRIGNLIHYFTGGENYVNTVDLQCLQRCVEDNQLFNFIHFKIPLTEEWLIKFGAEVFEFDNGTPKQYRLFDRLFIKRDGYLCDYGSSVVLKYVHKLQNFMFEVSNKELRLKQ